MPNNEKTWGEFQKALREMKIPQMCANCGQQPGTHSRSVQGNTGVQFSNSASQSLKFTFLVSLCDTCDRELTLNEAQMAKMDKQITIPGIILGFVVALILAIHVSQFYPPNLFTIIIHTLFYWALVMIPIMPLILFLQYRVFRPKGLININDIYSMKGWNLKFKNDNFQSQFASLNPLLVEEQPQPITEADEALLEGDSVNPQTVETSQVPESAATTPMDLAKLLADFKCPNCGSDKFELSWNIDTEGNSKGNARVECKKCGHITPVRPTPER